jgi:sRNA-binding protein
MDTHEKPAGGGIPQAGYGVAADTTKHSPSRARVEALAATLCERWPHLLTEPLRPLAVGIRDPIAAALDLDDVGLRALKAVLGRHTHRTAYLEAVIEGRPRIGLDGNDAGIPEERHVTYATEALARKAALREGKASPAVPKPASKPAAKPLAPKPAPQPRLLVERKKPVVVIKKRRAIGKGGAPCA